MKTRKTTSTKTMTVLICMLTAVLLFAACGKKIDYSAWTYDQFQKSGNYDEVYGYKDWNNWDEREVSYQLTGSLGTVGCPVIANLNKDGSVVIFTVIHFDVAAAGLDWLVPVDPDITNQVLNVYYGSWTKQKDAISFKYAKNAEEEFIEVPVTNNNGVLTCTVSANWLTYDFECELTGGTDVQYKTVQSMVDYALTLPTQG